MSLTFLRCRDSELVPKGIKIKRNFTPAQAARIYNRSKKEFLLERIHDNQIKVAHNDKILMLLSIELGNNIK